MLLRSPITTVRAVQPSSIAGVKITWAVWVTDVQINDLVYAAGYHQHQLMVSHGELLLRELQPLNATFQGCSNLVPAEQRIQRQSREPRFALVADSVTCECQLHTRVIHSS